MSRRRNEARRSDGDRDLDSRVPAETGSACERYGRQQDWLVAVSLNRRTDYQLDLFSEPVTVKQAITDYLEHKASSVTAATCRSYGLAVRLLLERMPEIGQLPIESFEVAHIAAIMRELGSEKPSKYLKSILIGTLDRAAKHGQRSTYNPVRIYVGRHSKSRSKRPSSDLIDGFMPAVAACERSGAWSSMISDFFRLAAIWGFRHSEILRLKPADIDLRERVIYIQFKKQRGSNRSPDEEFQIGEVAATILERRLAEVRNGILFTGVKGGKWSANEPWRKWPTLIEQLEADGVNVIDRATGDRILPSVTRSIAAKIRLRAGLSIPVIQHTMAHRRVQTTMSYAPGMAEEARMAMEITERQLFMQDNDKLRGGSRAETTAGNIKRRRLELGLSKDHCAARAGVTRQGWSYWEVRGCGLEKIDEVATILDTTPGKLLGLK